MEDAEELFLDFRLTVLAIQHCQVRSKIAHVYSDILPDPVHPTGEYTFISLNEMFILLALVVQTLDSAIHWINHSPVDKYLGKQLRYQLVRFLSSGQHYPTFEQPGPGELILCSHLVWLGAGQFQWSIGTNGTIGTNKK